MFFYRDSFGSGMGPGPETIDYQVFQAGAYSISANQIQLVTQPALSTPIPGPSTIAIAALGQGVDGQLALRGTQGVRITAGPAPALPTESVTTNGVEVRTGAIGTLTLHRGLLPTDQKVDLTPLGVSINAGSGKVSIESLVEITLSVAGGLSTIKLDPDGITIEGLQIKQLAKLQAELQTLANKVTAQLNELTSLLHKVT
jgi:hypothetical protein